MAEAPPPRIGDRYPRIVELRQRLSITDILSTAPVNSNPAVLDDEVGAALRQFQGQLEMRVAVGRRYRRTPVFSDTIRYLVFDPYWEIPASIAASDKQPEIKKDLGYLKKAGDPSAQRLGDGSARDRSVDDQLELAGPGQLPLTSAARSRSNCTGPPGSTKTTGPTFVPISMDGTTSCRMP